MAIVSRQLGQLRPADTTAASIYSPAASTTGIVKTITVCNTGTGTIHFRLFHDDNGTTYDETTAFVWDVPVGAIPHQINIFLPMNDSTGNLAVRTDTANDATFTVWGSEIT